MQRSNVAARAGRWSAQHRRAAILGWLAFVVAAVALGGAVGTKHIAQDNNGIGESGRAQQVLHEQFPQPAGEQVLIQSSDADRQGSGVPGGGQGCGRPALGAAARRERPLAADGREQW